MDYTWLALTAAALIQTLYALGWCTIRFWRTPIGWSLFFKGWALAAILDALVLGHWFEMPDAAWDVLATALAGGIFVQFAVFVRERWFAEGDDPC